MLIVLSPAKTLDMDTPSPTEEFSKSVFPKESKELVEVLREIPKKKFSELMSLSDKLTDLNRSRYKNFSFPIGAKNSKQALFAFQGDVYQGMDAAQYKKGDIRFAQKHLRILSGLYGVLRPLDPLQAYRLEMKTKLKTPKGKNLYEFWGTKITEALNRDLNEKSDFLLNLASREYFSAIDVSELTAPVVDVEFKEIKDGKAKIVAIHAKRARGLMADFIIKKRVKSLKGLEEFSEEGYQLQKKDSNEQKLLFTRKSA